jgi:hypothetical protein
LPFVATRSTSPRHRVDLEAGRDANLHRSTEGRMKMSGVAKAGFIRITTVAVLFSGVSFGAAQAQVRTPRATEPVPQTTTRPMTSSQEMLLGSLAKTGEVRMEKLAIKVDMSNPEATSNPYETVKKLLEKNSIPVNSLTLNSQTFLRNGGVLKCYHVVYPPAEKSNTICE